MSIQFYKNSVSSANLIDESVFVEIHRQSLLFDNQFKLGSTRCVSFTLKVMKNGIGSFDKIIVRENNLTNKHVLYLDSVDTSEDLFDTYVLCDSMLKFNKAYDGSTLTNNGQTSVTYLQILQDICSQAGVTCGVSSFNGSSKTTTAYDTTTPGRDYISWFAEMHGGFAYIDSSDRLQFNRFSTTVSATIDANECSSIKIGDLHKIQRVVFDNYDMHFESGTVSDGETLYLNVNNRMITEQADVTAVYNVIKNFSFYNIKIERCPILITLMPGQRIALSLNGVSYNTIAQIDHDYNLGWQGGFDCWLDNSEQVETQVIGEAQKRRIMEVKYDAELNEFSRTLTDIADDVSANTTAITQNASNITAVANRTTANENAIGQLQVTADGISADVSSLETTVDGTVSSITYKYAKGDSETRQPEDNTFTYDTMPAVEDGKWIWRKTVITYVSGQTSTRYEMIQGLDGHPGTPGAPGTPGKSVTITSTSINYAKSTDGTQHPDSGWGTSVPTLSTGEYLWTRTIVNYSDGNSTTSYSVGYKGTNGTNVTITSKEIAYVKDTQGATPPASTASWSTNFPTNLTNGDYLWTRTTVNYSSGGSTVSYSVSYIGTNGTSPTAYSLQASAYAVIRNVNSSDALSPTTITFSGYSQTGNGAWGAYAGRFKIYTTTDNSTWAAAYTSSSNQSSYTYTIPAGKTGIKCELYLAGGTSTLVDSQTIPIVDDGKNGTNGQPGSNGADAYTVILSNESHTFAATSDGKAIAGNTQVNVIAYKGATQVAATIGTISGLPTGMTAPITSNGTTSAYFTPTVTTSMATKTGVLTVPITVDGKSFTKKFSYSLAVAGTGISSIAYKYLATQDQNKPQASAVTLDSIPTLSPTNKYLWQKETITYNNGTTTENVTLIGVYGDTGVGVQSMFPLYYMADGALDMELQGNTKQTGKNLVDIHNNTPVSNNISYVGTGGIRFTATSTSQYLYSSVWLSNGLLGKTITASATVTSGGTGASPRMAFYWLTSSGQPVSGGSIARVDGTGAKTVTATIPSSLPSGATSLGMLFYSTLNTSGEANSTYSQFDKLQVEIGSTATDYEPYFGTIPSPDYPVPVHSVSGDNTITVCGFNMFDKSKLSNGYINDINGAFVANGSYRASDFMPVKPNTQYYIKTDQTSGRWGAWYNEHKLFVKGISGVTGLVTAPSNAYYFRWTVVNGSNGNVDTFCFNQSDTAKNGTYEPYTAQEYPITLPVENLLDISNYSYIYTNMSVADNSIIISSLGSGSTSRVYFSQTFASSEYTISATCPEGITPRIWSDKEFSGGTYNSYYNGWFKEFTNYTSVTLASESKVGLIFTGTAGIQATITNIQLEKGSKANTYQPYSNLINISQEYNSAQFSLSGTTLTNTVTDTRTDFRLQVQLFNGSTAVRSVVSEIVPTGYFNRTINFGDLSNITRFCIKSNGSSRDLMLCWVPIDGFEANTDYILSMDIIGINPSVAGGLVVSNIRITKPTISIELNKIGDYADYFHNDNGTWYLHKEVKKITYDNSNYYANKNSSDTSNYLYYITARDSSNALKSSQTGIGYCDQLVAVNNLTTLGTAVGFSPTRNYDVIYLGMAGLISSNDTDTARAWLGEKAPTFYFSMYTPQEYEVTDTTLLGQLNAISQAMSYNGVTNILQDNNDLPFNIVYNEQAGVAPNPPTAEVTTATDAPDIWTINKPTFIDGYRYYNCLQIKMTDSSVSWTDVLSDTEFQALDGKIIELTRTTSETSAHIAELDDSINSIVKRTDTIEQSYVTANGLEDRISLVKSDYETKIDQTAKNINFSISEVQSTLDGVQSDLTTYFDFSQDGLVIGKSSSEIKQQFTNDSTQFIDSSNTVYGRISAKDGIFGSQLALGNADTRTQRWYLKVGGSDYERFDIDRYSND